MHSNDSLPDLNRAQDLGLTKEEFERINKIMGRAPNFTELSLFSIMWSERCSSKNAIHWLQNLPKEGNHVLDGLVKENTGLVDIGNGLACAFKMASNNHSSAIEPQQGAATALGNSYRAIFAMGAQPLAALHSLCFGNIEEKKNTRLIKGVTSGISNYGNRFGVPTVGSEVCFHDSYDQSILVNAMSVGIVKIDEIVSAKADGPGNPVFIVGSPTGRDGIPKAALPSVGLTENADRGERSVQVSDPFQEKLLLEATREVIKTGAIIGMQDIGVGGIVSATAEMSTRSGTGMRIALEKIPVSSSGMQPLEILLSEHSQRMLIVVESGKEHLLFDIFEKWDLECKLIGEVTDTGQLVFLQNDERVTEVSAQALVPGGVLVNNLPTQRPKYLKTVSKFKNSKVKKPTDYLQAAWKIFSSPNIASKKWMYEQYDSMVQINSISTTQPSDASLIRVKGTHSALALTTNCNPAYVYADPCIGTLIAVSEAARNIVCSGGEPLALTHCFNFGDPYDEEVYWQFVQVIKGINGACRKLGIPVTRGHVSFYNQSIDGDSKGAVYPTPTIGMIGLLNDYEQAMTLHFKEEGHQIYMLGTPQNDLGSSEYLRVVHMIPHSPAPIFDIDEECHIQRNVKKIIKMGLIQSAHDISEGGLFVSLIECAMFNNLGFDIESDTNFRKDAYLFGESQSRIVVTTTEETEDELVNYLNSNNVPFSKLGEVIGKNAVVDGKKFDAISKWKAFYDNFIADKLK